MFLFHPSIKISSKLFEFSKDGHLAFKNDILNIQRLPRARVMVELNIRHLKLKIAPHSVEFIRLLHTGFPHHVRIHVCSHFRFQVLPRLYVFGQLLFQIYLFVVHSWKPIEIQRWLSGVQVSLVHHHMLILPEVYRGVRNRFGAAPFHYLLLDDLKIIKPLVLLLKQKIYVIYLFFVFLSLNICSVHFVL